MPAGETQSEDMQSLREELDHFIRLSQVQAEQLTRYQDLQRRSHQLILRLNDQLQQLKATGSTSFRK